MSNDAKAGSINRMSILIQVAVEYFIEMEYHFRLEYLVAEAQRNLPSS
jgi:hypothetical protein